jgi:hypothetical protein
MSTDGDDDDDDDSEQMLGSMAEEASDADDDDAPGAGQGKKRKKKKKTAEAKIPPPAVCDLSTVDWLVRRVRFNCLHFALELAPRRFQMSQGPAPSTRGVTAMFESTAGVVQPTELDRTGGFTVMRHTPQRDCKRNSDADVAPWMPLMSLARRDSILVQMQSLMPLDEAKVLPTEWRFATEHFLSHAFSAEVARNDLLAIAVSEKRVDADDVGRLEIRFGSFIGVAYGAPEDGDPEFDAQGRPVPYTERPSLHGRGMFRITRFAHPLVLQQLLPPQQYHAMAVRIESSAAYRREWAGAKTIRRWSNFTEPPEEFLVDFIDRIGTIFPGLAVNSRDFERTELPTVQEESLNISTRPCSRSRFEARMDLACRLLATVRSCLASPGLLPVGLRSSVAAFVAGETSGYTLQRRMGAFARIPYVPGACALSGMFARINGCLEAGVRLMANHAQAMMIVVATLGGSYHEGPKVLKQLVILCGAPGGGKSMMHQVVELVSRQVEITGHETRQSNTVRSDQRGGVRICEEATYQQTGVPGATNPRAIRQTLVDGTKADQDQPDRVAWAKANATSVSSSFVSTDMSSGRRRLDAKETTHLFTTLASTNACAVTQDPSMQRRSITMVIPVTVSLTSGGRPDVMAHATIPSDTRAAVAMTNVLASRFGLNLSDAIAIISLLVGNVGLPLDTSALMTAVSIASVSVDMRVPSFSEKCRRQVGPVLTMMNAVAIWLRKKFERRW